ncbi:zeta toxin family protein [Aggregatibacter actinomycetemcomitans]|uniref:zeta toxin family protein n=1 Tax=Aggregatibacter actinomycetemcomitans TaxID=714 RepID=UPI001E44CCF0|nr:zeta toxin family protein [Aggregatibacter actinomycetemcomitans]
MAENIKVNLDDVESIYTKEILKRNLKGNDNPYVIFITGVSGSGKSTLIKELNGNFIKIQADNYRKLYPKINEVKEKIGRNEAYKKTGNYSFEFAKKLRDKSIEKKLNVIFEATFSKIETAQSLIKPFIENGYKVFVVKLPIDIELSFQRNITRYEEKKAQEHTIPRITSREDIEKMAGSYGDTLNEVRKQGIKIVDKSELNDLVANLNKLESSRSFKKNVEAVKQNLSEKIQSIATENHSIKFKP